MLLHKNSKNSTTILLRFKILLFILLVGTLLSTGCERDTRTPQEKVRDQAKQLRRNVPNIENKEPQIEKTSKEEPREGSSSSIPCDTIVIYRDAEPVCTTEKKVVTIYDTIKVKVKEPKKEVKLPPKKENKKPTITKENKKPVIVYVVSKGETLYSISKKLGVTQEHIIEKNKLPYTVDKKTKKKIFTVYKGQKLNI